ncbi:bifunctional [glutamate--ammonia ligase]-adenylyl-L-tyrosine phosphorylase/[glutamate--ammonia-ligase] adenylyltransferase [Sinimarinibacterium sp. NLF-5-8]|uniref:bifunctional [glutamate--ammonia ligase]-adenylyl-L-tyrosine phosphorylase/[glutamate--ammonia-ligase] adenylyltransferase n=1 Tax=Sinimarinibacterium sp. NLF-5-8 TaxID=2698684 RepID=UPI00137BD41A|nr:bifunctional [glutamate--ammonia ligase]-adenylyl-L-tyrosine phosphorylase/[glutamate--ammonia-ligase] adenylyltransferase [Sinimarinibacterium sp. NLF-5-8]QHS08767.1 bifunctional [glutamate--ammonia ligase]-adenylyl-L-tyrosine phosphorylase/[glutamate--ammonia-ligase] adenylyltransferase [Sinimarinibacterium sp. NLF-5-8]
MLLTPEQLQPLLAQQAPALAAVAPRVLQGSRFVREVLGLLLDAQDDLHDFSQPYKSGRIDALLNAAMAEVTDAATAMRALRRVRRRQMARIAFRDLAGWAGLNETLRDLSDLAEACVQAALKFAENRLQQRYGVPRSARGEVVRPVVLAMGKLGGQELNFSSDIDLIFCHTDSGECDGRGALSSDEYFAKLSQDVTRLLVAQTEDGFVFRVDTMLRPFGSAGALSASFAALEDYYQVHGREWERYALIKARPIAGSLPAGARLLQMLRPFVYRRYLDYNAIGALRQLKKLIEDEVARKGLEDNIKLGAGGIREVEFIVQSFQLVRGGSEPRLRDHRLRRVLRFLGAEGYLTAAVASQLDDAYVFLRRLENAIQMYADQQSHALPDDARARAALLAALDFEDWQTLSARLEQVRGVVREQFSQVFSAHSDAEHSPHLRLVSALWSGTLTADEALDALTSIGFKRAPQRVFELLRALHELRLVRAMSEQTALRLLQLLAQLFDEVLQHPDPEVALERTFKVLEAIAGRSNYLILLLESDVARSSLVRLCAASPWLTGFIARAPIVLDRLLDLNSLYSPPLREEIFAELAERAALLATPLDTEQAMDLLRHYHREITLRVAAADLAQALPLVKVSDRLTWLAEAVVQHAVAFAWADMRAQYGEPHNRDGRVAGFAVIAYGKFGGIELGYGSDLDLVFLHDCDQLDEDSHGGARAIDNGTYLARLAQRVISQLSTQTAAGRAYDVDMELRPNGRSGLIVSSITSFADYQRSDAWTWEHQALTRARWVAGAASLQCAFDRVRAEILMRARDDQKLRADILEMRARMRLELDRSSESLWDIKQGEGGLVDIEFITQYLVLRDAHRDPRIIEWSDNWRQLDALAEAGSIGAEDKEDLIHCYRSYRSWAHQCSLQQAPTMAAAHEFAAKRSKVMAIVQRCLGAPLAVGTSDDG